MLRADQYTRTLLKLQRFNHRVPSHCRYIFEHCPARWTRFSGLHTSTKILQQPQLDEGRLAGQSRAAPSDHRQDLSPAPTRSSPIVLRPYQVDCVNAVLSTLREGIHTRLGVSSPTGKSLVPRVATSHDLTDLPVSVGSGKTAIFTSLIRRLPELVNPVTGVHATQVLIIVNSIVLAHQAADTVKRAYPAMVRRVLLKIGYSDTRD